MAAYPVDTKAALKEFRVTGSDNAIGKQILKLGLPENVLITLINTDERFLVPKGSTAIEDQDRLLILSNKKRRL